jgi:hypothetical protein
MKPISFEFVTWLPLPFELQEIIFTLNYKRRFLDTKKRIDDDLVLKPMRLWNTNYYYRNKFSDSCRVNLIFEYSKDTNIRGFRVLISTLEVIDFRY